MEHYAAKRGEVHAGRWAKGEVMRATIVAMLLVAASQSRAEPTNAPPNWLHAKTTFTLVAPWDAQGLLNYACTRSGMPFNVSPKLLPANGAPKVGLVCNFRDTEVRYIIAWVARFLDATVRIEDGTIHVRPRIEQPTNDPIFECTEETEGEWKAMVEGRLLTRLAYDSPDSLPFDKWIKAIGEKAEFPLIVAPPVGLPDTTQPTLQLSTAEQTCAELLTSALGTIGMTYRIQGGVVFITN